VHIDAIIKGCKEGNRKCQDALVQKFAPGLLSLCARYTSDRELARDALQECFINAFRFIDKYEGKGSFEGWLRRIAVTSSIALNKKFSQLKFDELEEDTGWASAELPDIYDQMNTEDLMKLIKKLPESLYLVFNLYVVEGYQHNEISGLLGITESTSRSALCKARTKLITIIEQNSKVAIAQAC
jgi:RNA polymerase sigma factor (sigma-70 family)